MTVAPTSLLNLRSYLIRQGAPVLGIVGDADHKGGYHLGLDRLRPTDYSLRQPRDKAGATDAAAGIDIGRFTDLIALGRFLRVESFEGRAPDIREVIAERSNATHVWRYDAVTRLTTGDPASQELPHHIHVSYYRDSEARDKRPPYRQFFEPAPEEPMAVHGIPDKRPATFASGTPYFDDAGKQLGTIGSSTKAYQIVGQSDDHTLLLIDGGGTGQLRWVKAADARR